MSLKQRKQVKISITKLLKIVELLNKYKDTDEVDQIYQKVAAALSLKLLASEIESYSEWYLTEEAENMGYEKDHYDDAVFILNKFKQEYCNPDTKES